MCVYFLFHWFSGENCMFLLSLHKGRQTSKELKRNMNDGTIVFLMTLLIVFLLKKRLWLFSCEFCKFSENDFLTKFLWVTASDLEHKLNAKKPSLLMAPFHRIILNFEKKYSSIVNNIIFLPVLTIVSFFTKNIYFCIKNRT